jgi:hypothetical protein
MALSGLNKTVAAGLIGLAATFTTVAPATAQEASAPQNIAATLKSEIQSASREKVKEACYGAIGLHFGNGFSEREARVISQHIIDSGYSNVLIFSGGPENELSLCINGKFLKSNFTQETATDVLDTVKKAYAHLMADAQNDNSIPPKLEG